MVIEIDAIRFLLTIELKDIAMKRVTLSLLLMSAFTLLGQPGVYAGDNEIFEKTLVAEHTEHSERHEPLKFTDAQLELIHAIKAKYFDADEPNISQLHRLHRKSFELMSGLNVSKDDLMLVQSKINTIEAELANQRLRMSLELRDVLTVEQKAEIHKHMIEREAGPGMPPPSFPPPPGMGPGYSLEQLPLLGPGTPQAGSGAGSLPRTAAPASRAGLQVKEPSQTVS
jgi:Spy/CpxP family protein refolding chaperone